MKKNKKKLKSVSARLEFPMVTDADIAFGGYPGDWFNEVMKIPKETEWSKKAGELFFKGGKVDLDRKLPDEYLYNGLQTLKCVLGSFMLKHEHKEHVAGLILKSLCE